MVMVYVLQCNAFPKHMFLESLTYKEKSPLHAPYSIYFSKILIKHCCNIQSSLFALKYKIKKQQDKKSFILSTFYFYRSVFLDI